MIKRGPGRPRKTPLKQTPLPSPSVEKVTRSMLDIAIEERLAACGRGESEHIVYVGEMVERALKSEIGAVLKALTAGRVSQELQNNTDGKLSSDRILGRLEMADRLWQDLEQFVIDKDKANQPLPTESFDDTHVASVPGEQV